MDFSNAFLVHILNTIDANLTVLDNDFNIVLVNKSWDRFSLSNGCPSGVEWVGKNYLSACSRSAEKGDEFSITVIEGFEKLQAGEIDTFSLEYPCHSPDVDRWFIMNVAIFSYESKSYYVVTHQDITKRVKLEEENRRLATLDGLTGIPNHRTFEEFLANEWAHCRRNGFPISLAFIDLDDFKLINDSGGHLAGDICLKEIAKIISHYTGRASDICARFGGDEFVVVWGNITHEQAKTLTKSILEKINQIDLSDSEGHCVELVTASIGLSTEIPESSELENFIASADSLLYQAKEEGKNRICAEFKASAYGLS